MRGSRKVESLSLLLKKKRRSGRGRQGRLAIRGGGEIEQQLWVGGARGVKDRALIFAVADMRHPFGLMVRYHMKPKNASKLRRAN